MLKSSPSSAFETLRRNQNHSNEMSRDASLLLVPIWSSKCSSIINVSNQTVFQTGDSDIRNAGDGDIMFDDANINFVRDCGGGGGMYQAGPGVVLPRNKVMVV